MLDVIYLVVIGAVSVLGVLIIGMRGLRRKK